MIFAFAAELEELCLEGDSLVYCLLTNTAVMRDRPYRAFIESSGYLYGRIETHCNGVR